MKTQKHRIEKQNIWEKGVYIEFRIWNAIEWKKYVKSGMQTMKI